MVQITLKEQVYNGRLDFRTIANIQCELRKRGMVVGLQDIFERIKEQDFNVITELVVQSILRCHPKLKRHMIEDKLDLDEMVNAIEFTQKLVESSITVKTTEEGK